MMYLTRSEQLELELSCANDEIIKLQKQLADERDALKAKLAASEAALHRFQHGQQIEGDYVCAAAEKERAVIDGLRKQLDDSEAARLKAVAACAALTAACEWVISTPEGYKLVAESAENPNVWVEEGGDDLMVSTDAGQPILDYIAAARRLREIIEIRLSVVKQNLLAPYLADVDAADAKLQVSK